MKMKPMLLMFAIVGGLMVAAWGCVDGEDIISADPNYNGPGELVSCGPVPNCPKVCRYYVDTEGSATANGRSWTTALRHIQPAINKAHCTIQSCTAITQCDVWVAGRPKAGDTTDSGDILPPKDYSMASNNRDSVGTIRVRNNISLYGGFAGTETTPDDRWFVKDRSNSISDRTVYMSLSGLHGGGGNNTRTMEMERKSRVDGFSFENSRLSADEYGPTTGGGAIKASGTNATISNCSFESNGGSGITGGAVLIDGGNASISHSAFIDNEAMEGGAVAVIGGSATFNHSIFHANTADRNGGAIFRENGIDLKIENSILSANYADWGGGAVASVSKGLPGSEPHGNESLAVINSIFLSNIADRGSAIEVMSVLETTAVNTVQNAIFYNNVNTGSCGTIDFDEGGQITNSIIWTEMEQHTCDLVSNANISYSVVKNGHPGVGNINANPMIQLEPLSLEAGGGYANAFTYSLDPTSPCIDAGDGNSAPETDMAGNVRTDIVDVPNTGIGAINYTDIGAIEALATTVDSIDETSVK